MNVLYIRFAALGSGARQRAPTLERLLVRASRAVPIDDWRNDAFGVLAAPGEVPGIGPAMPQASPGDVPGIGPAMLQASHGAVPGLWACLATPMHFIAGMSSVTLADGGLLTLAQPEADELAVAFNEVFTDSGARLFSARCARLVCVFDRRMQVVTCDPDELTGKDMYECQPSGRDAAFLRRVMTEVEMWLFDHPINQARMRRASLPLTGLWLWGGGPVLDALPMLSAWTAGCDPLFAAFGDSTQFPRSGGSGIWVCDAEPGSTAWSERSVSWLAQAEAAFRAGQFGRMELSAGARRLTVTRGRSWKLWRHPRPWWEYFELQGGAQNGDK